MAYCKNCNTPLSESAKFCEQCGAKVIHNRLTLRNIFDDFSEQFLNWDNKILRTFIDLFRQPEVVINGYISGTRKRYMNVLSYFAIAITLSGFYMYINQKFFPDTFSKLFEKMSNDPNQMQASLDFYQNFIEYQSFIFFLMIPILAGMSRLVFLKNKKFNYSEHLVLNMYTYSQASILITLIAFVAQFNEDAAYVFQISSLAIQILFFAYVLKRVFALNLIQIILKTLLFLVVLIPVYIIFVIIATIYMLLFTDAFQNIMEVEKAKRGISYVISSARNWTS
ncbi:DUF3667 domain-containing protein [Constantimarinum furrinae]|uniref:Zinc-ribbon domain-containing protein n=1 Tax=Constantimarinum furrinae TaxID=2562285 RepID=A0A7G8PR50_9FLAO|nr:DUF3667 domain-containing protein [Constantimarinum furrinae]QNJ96816.1 hypothetical protein ALE3EI_0226 [Constantimarinum furrinae]